MNKLSLSWLCLIISTVGLASSPQTPLSAPDFSGTYDRIRQLAVLTDSRGGTRPDYQLTAQQARLKPEYQQARDERQKSQRDADERGEPLVGRTAQCQGNGMPGMMGGPWPIEFIQSKDQLTVIQEIYTQVRRIYIGKPQKKPEDIEAGFYGHSVGHWDGQILLVDTIGLKPTLNTAMPNSEKIHIKERIYFAADGTLHNDVWVEDPLVLEQPYSYSLMYQRLPDYEMLEYICEDNHYYIDSSGKQVLRTGDASN